jgi:hypothetical protein
MRNTDLPASRREVSVCVRPSRSTGSKAGARVSSGRLAYSGGDGKVRDTDSACAAAASASILARSRVFSPRRRMRSQPSSRDRHASGHSEGERD